MTGVVGEQWLLQDMSLSSLLNLGESPSKASNVLNSSGGRTPRSASGSGGGASGMAGNSNSCAGGAPAAVIAVNEDREVLKAMKCSLPLFI